MGEEPPHLAPAMALDPVQVRVLGALVEKQHTTPEYYPLTLNALVSACNQKSNRSPVVQYDEKTVTQALQGLRDRGLARTVSGADMRVPKHYHLLAGKLELTPPQTAVMCVLMLRGAQTAGEIRGRTSRLYTFADLNEVQRTLDELTKRQTGPLVVLLPRVPGQKEQRYTHTFTPPPEVDSAAPETEITIGSPDDDRVTGLEKEMEAVRAELNSLREQFDRFRQQFE